MERNLVATPGNQFFHPWGRVKGKIAASVVLDDLFILNEECFGWYYYISDLIFDGDQNHLDTTTPSSGLMF